MSADNASSPRAAGSPEEDTPTAPRPPAPQVPPPIVMDSSSPTFSYPPAALPVPSTSVVLPRVEGTLFAPLPELDLPHLPFDEEELPVLLSGPSVPAPSVLTMPTPITPTFPLPPPGVGGSAILSGYLSPFRQVSPAHSLEAHLPSAGPAGVRPQCPTYLLSTAVQAEAEPPTGSAAAAAAGPSTPFQSYLRNPYLRDRVATASPPFGRHSSSGGRTGTIAGKRRREEFDHNEYLDLGADFPEEAQLPYDASPDPTEMVAAFQRHMQDKGKADDRATMALLIRYALPVRGVKMLQIRCELHHWYKDWVEQHGAVPVATQKEFAFLLIESEWYEDKLAAVLFMQEVLMTKKNITHADLPRFEAMFRAGHVKVYKVCDHFAEKVLCHLARLGGQNAAQAERTIDVLFEWTRADDVWQARAALSALAVQAGKVLLHERLLEAVQVMLARPEEEAKSTAGTALRSISDVDAVAVIEFLNKPENIVNTSVNALQKATSRLTTEQKEHFKTLRRDASARRRR